jgi:hypothetical protein
LGSEKEASRGLLKIFFSNEIVVLAPAREVEIPDYGRASSACLTGWSQRLPLPLDQSKHKPL